MDRRAFLTAAGATALGAQFYGTAARSQGFDYDAIGRIKTHGLGMDTSRVMQDSSYLMDVLGPRLTASPGIQKSGEWVVRKMREYGFDRADLEPWPTDGTGNNNGFPRGWENRKFYLHATSPQAWPVTGMCTGWTPGTNGLVSGECVLVTETAEADVRSKYAGQLRGKWILGQNPPDIPSQWNPVARRYTTEQLDNMEVPPRGAEFGTAPGRGGTPAAAAAPGRGGGGGGGGGAQPTPPFNRNNFFRDEGALGLFSTNKGHGVINVFGSNNRGANALEQLPGIVIIAEHYNRIARALRQGARVVVEADIQNEWTTMPAMFNVVGEIRGAQRPDEVVIVGGHFDSFHASTGATDNGGQCMMAMEALRILKAVNAPLNRTVRVCMWNGEEQGLIGSRLYVSRHFGGARGAPQQTGQQAPIAPLTPDHARFQAYFNLDNGSGAIRGINAQGNQALIPIFRQWMEPFRDIGASHVTPRSTGSTDHTSFDNAGLPGFQFIQDPLEYEPTTHHTNMDFLDSMQPEDARRNATILAGFAFLAANHPERLPRKPLPDALRAMAR